MIVFAATREGVEVVGAEEKLPIRSEGRGRGNFLAVKNEVLEMNGAGGFVQIGLIQGELFSQEQGSVGEILGRERAGTIGKIKSIELSLIVVSLIQGFVGLRRIGDDHKGIQFLERIPIGEALLRVRIGDPGDGRAPDGRTSEIVNREDEAWLLGLQDTDPVFDFLNRGVHHIAIAEIPEATDAGIDRQGTGGRQGRVAEEFPERIDGFFKRIAFDNVVSI